VTEILTSFTPEMDYDEMAIDLPPATPVVFLIAKSFLVKFGCLGGIS
jgi:hypothetical protein